MLCLHCGTFFCLDEWPHGPEGENSQRLYCSANCKARAKKRRNPKPKPGLCPTPGKIAYEDIVTARQDAGEVLQRHGELRRPYRCRCGQWHLTSSYPWKRSGTLLLVLFSLLRTGKASARASYSRRGHRAVGEPDGLAPAGDRVNRTGDGLEYLCHEKILHVDGIANELPLLHTPDGQSCGTPSPQGNPSLSKEKRDNR